jgi:hypothetical protein
MDEVEKVVTLCETLNIQCDVEWFFFMYKIYNEICLC